MNIERLTKLADFLDTVPERRFDLSRWRAAKGTIECGFAGCAVGWASLIPEFRVDGLTLDSEWGEPVFLHWESWLAVERFFDLSTRQAERLFGRSEYQEHPEPTPIDVTKRIRTLVNRSLARKVKS